MVGELIKKESRPEDEETGRLDRGFPTRTDLRCRKFARAAIFIQLSSLSCTLKPRITSFSEWYACARGCIPLSKMLRERRRRVFVDARVPLTPLRDIVSSTPSAEHANGGRTLPQNLLCTGVR